MTAARATATGESATWDAEPSLVAEASGTGTTAAAAGLRYWLTEVAQGALAGRPDGYDPALAVPAHMLAPGPLRAAITPVPGKISLSIMLLTGAVARTSRA